MIPYPKTHRDVANLVGKVIVFNDKVEFSEIDFDRYMAARVVGFRTEPDYFQLTLNFAEFEEVNKKFMKSNYYDKDSNPTLKWCDTRYYPADKQCNDYFSYSGACEDSDCFDVID